MYSPSTSRAVPLSKYLNTLDAPTGRYVHCMLWHEVMFDIDTTTKSTEWVIEDTTVVTPLANAIRLCCDNITTVYDLETNKLQLYWNVEDMETAQSVIAEVYQILN